MSVRRCTSVERCAWCQRTVCRFDDESPKWPTLAGWTACPPCHERALDAIVDACEPVDDLVDAR